MNRLAGASGPPPPSLLLTRRLTNKRVSNERTYAFVIFDDVLADAGQRRPLAVVDGLNCAAFVRLELADLAAESV